jgi:hypothetical protein
MKVFFYFHSSLYWSVLTFSPRERMISSLLTEILITCFEYLSHTELSRISTVCKRWSVVAHNKLLWTKLDVSATVLQEDHPLSQILRNHVDDLEYLRLTLHSPLRSVGTVLAGFSKLHTLSLNVHGTDFFCPSFVSLLGKTY